MFSSKQLMRILKHQEVFILILHQILITGLQGIDQQQEERIDSQDLGSLRVMFQEGRKWSSPKEAVTLQILLVGTSGNL